VNFFISNSRNYLAVFGVTLGVLLVLVALGSEWLIRTQVEPNDSLYYHLQLFRNARTSDIALGDSHTANGFAARNGFLNLGFPNENISAIARKVAVYIKGKPPGRVVLQADPHMFAAYQVKTDVGYLAYLEKPAGHSSLALSEIRLLNDYHRPKVFAYWLAYFRHGKLQAHDVIHPNGWLPSEGNWLAVNPDKRVSQARWRADIQRPVNGFAALQPVRDYRDTVRLLVHQGWKPCLVEYPASQEWLDSTQDADFEKARAWYRALAAETGVKYLGYHAIYRGRPELFSNQDHLNPAGAKIFTGTVIKDCFGNTDAVQDEP
jgi:hypothetical protein